VVVLDLGDELVARVLLLDPADDVGRHAERVGRRLLVVVGREDGVLDDVRGRLAQVEHGDLVVAGRGGLAGAVVALVGDVTLGGDDPGVALAVAPEVRALPAGVAPVGRLDGAVAPLAEDPEVQVHVALPLRGVPSEAGREDLARVGGELLGLSLGHLHLLCHY